jgi:hypothetical protein
MYPSQQLPEEERNEGEKYGLTKKTHSIFDCADSMNHRASWRFQNTAAIGNVGRNRENAELNSVI